MGSDFYIDWKHCFLQVVAPFEVFSRCPTLKFKLSWGKTPLQGEVESPAPIPLMEERRNHRNCNNHIMDRDKGKWAEECVTQVAMLGSSHCYDPVVLFKIFQYAVIT